MSCHKHIDPEHINKISHHVFLSEPAVQHTVFVTTVLLNFFMIGFSHSLKKNLKVAVKKLTVTSLTFKQNLNHPLTKKVLLFSKPNKGLWCDCSALCGPVIHPNWLLVTVTNDIFYKCECKKTNRFSSVCFLISYLTASF